MSLIKYVMDTNSKLIPADSVTDANTRKQYISREDFNFYYVEKNLTRTEFADLGVGSKTFLNSYHLYYSDKRERSKIRATKSRRHKQGNIYNVANNDFKLSAACIVDKEELEKMLLSGASLCIMCKHFSISEPTLHKNIQYHGLGILYSKHLMGTTHVALTDLERLTGIAFIDYLKPSVSFDTASFKKDIYTAELAVQKCKDLLASLRYRFNLGASAIPKSRYERYLIEFLIDNKIQFIPQYSIENTSFDVFIPKFNLLIEIDGEGHHTKTDEYKNTLAEVYNHKLLRLDFSKWKSKKVVLEKVRSVLSKELEGMGYGTFK